MSSKKRSADALDGDADAFATERQNADTLPPEPEQPPNPAEMLPEGPTIEEHAAELGTHPATFAAMKAYFRLGEGRKVSREHYDELIAHVENLKFQ